MKDKSKILTVINTGKRKVESEQAVQQIVRGGAGIGSPGGAYLLKSIWDKCWEIRKTDNGEEYIFGKLPVAVQYGLTSYVDVGNLKLPDIYDGLNIDNQTLYWEETTEETTDEEGNAVTNVVKILKSKAGEGALTLGGLLNVGEWADEIPETDRILVQKAGSEMWEGMDIANIGTANFDNIEEEGEGNAYTSFRVSEVGGVETLFLLKEKTFVDSEYLKENFYNKNELSEKYYDKKYIDDNFSKKTYVDETFVTLKGDPQTIESQKNFIGGLQVNGNPIVYNAEQGYWKLEGDLLVTGGIASFSDDTAYDPTSIMDAIVCDEHTITVEESNGVKRLKVIGGGTSGGVDEDAVRELIESYKYLDKVATINIYNSVGSSIMSYDGTTNRTLTLSKSHVGLANVENTALSSWTGNSHISKVGTITSGTWNGTSIGASYLPTATTSAKGIASFDSSYFSVSSGKVSFTGGGVKIVSSLPSSRTKNTLYVITG